MNLNAYKVASKILVNFRKTIFYEYLVSLYHIFYKNVQISILLCLFIEIFEIFYIN